MKQMKFVLVALMTVLMGVSFTSCLNGDDNTQVNDRSILGKVTDNFLSLTFVSLDGYTFKAKNMVSGATDFQSGDYIIASCSYDTKTDLDPTSNVLNVTVGSVEKISGNQVWGTNNPSENYQSNRGVISVTDLTPGMIDNYNLLLPIQYYAFEKIDSHMFMMTYNTDEEEIKKDKVALKLYLRHTSSEETEKETYRAFSYRVFNLADAINKFKTVNERYPSRIEIVAEINISGNSVPNTTTSTSIDYKFVEQN